jgi:C4-dicarboxylate-binding protein DctP
MNVSITAWMAQIEPRLIVLDMPYLWGSMEEFVGFWETEAGRNLVGGLEKRNVRALAIWPTGNIVIATRRPIRKLEDFKGLKMRVFGGRAHELALRALGGQGATIPAPEVAAAIETGVVDGLNGAQAYWANNFPAKLKYATRSNMWRNGFGVWANAKFWDGLPASARSAMEQAMKEATAFELKTVIEQETESSKKAVAQGAEVITATPEEDARWKAATAAIPGQYPDIADLVTQIRASAKK